MEHPEKRISGSKGTELKGKRIVLGVTGSVSAYVSADIARTLIRHGADVHAVMTRGALKIVHPNLLEWATGNPVVTELTGSIEHVAFTTGPGRADLILIAPATGNTIGKMASGIDDTPVTSYVSSALGAKIPILVCPAMHDTMLSHPIIQENIRKLEKAGVSFVPPRMEEGKAKLPEPEAILAAVISKLSKRDMDGIRVLITGGPTVEPIDAARVVTNRSSGKMAVALAGSAISRGADVTLVYGPGLAAPPSGGRVMSVETARDMSHAVRNELKSRSYDLFIAAAAVSDYAPAKLVKGKLSSADNHELSVVLRATPKVVNEVKRLSPKTVLVLFKAEAGRGTRAIANAKARMKETGAELAVLNDISRNDVGFGTDDNEVAIIEPNGRTKHIGKRPKPEVAGEILTLALKLVRRRRGPRSR